MEGDRIIGRRLLLASMTAALSLSACGGDGPPSRSTVRTVVKARLMLLAREFAAGNYGGVPPHVMEHLDDTDRERIRALVGSARIVSFSSGDFARRPDGAWVGSISFEVAVPMPGAPVSVSAVYGTTGEAALRRDADGWRTIGFAHLKTTRSESEIEDL